MFPLTPEEVERLRSQFATSKLDQGEGAIALSQTDLTAWANLQDLEEGGLFLADPNRRQNFRSLTQEAWDGA